MSASETEKLSNKYISMAIDSGAARVIQLNIDGDNLFFVNPREAGKSYYAAPEAPWHNFGGARFDVAPQKSWEETPWGKDWPPPPVLNSPREISIDGDQINLSTYEDATLLGVKVLTDISILSGSSIVNVSQSVKNLSAVQRSWANWDIVQLLAIEDESRIFVARSEKTQLENGFTVLMEPKDKSFIPILEEVSANSAVFVFGGHEFKLGFTSVTWIAFRAMERDKHVFVLMGEHDPNAQYPDGGALIQFYSSGNMPYVELEMTGPLAELKPNEVRADSFKWGVTTCTGDVLNVTDAGVVTKQISEDGQFATGAYGVFYEGIARVFQKQEGREAEIAAFHASPLRPLEIKIPIKEEKKNATYRVELHDLAGRNVGNL